MSILQTELTDPSFLTEIDPRIPLLYDSEGQIINNCYEVKDKHGKRWPTSLSEQTDAFFKALNYMALRSNLHLLAAREIKADLLLSPMRSLLQWGGYNLFFMKNSTIKPPVHTTGNKMSYMGTKSFPGVQIAGIPMLAYWIAKQMPGRPGFIHAAMELREEKEFAAVRRCLSELSDRIAEDITADPETAVMYIEKLNRYYAKIAKKYRIGLRKGSYSAYIALMGSTPHARNHMPGIESFAFELKPPVPPFVTPTQEVKHCGAVYRPFGEDLAMVDLMEDYISQVASRVWFKPEDALMNIKTMHKSEGIPV